MKIMTTAVFTAVLCGTPATADEMNALLDKAIEAQGGAKNLDKYKAFVQTVEGELDLGGMKMEFTGTTSVLLPGRLKKRFGFEVNGRTVAQTLVYDGKKGKGYSATRGRTIEHDERARESSRQELHAEWIVRRLTPLRDREKYQLKPVPEIETDGKPAVGMKVSREGYKDVVLYFDKKTSLLVKHEFTTVNPVGPDLHTEAYYAGHQEKGGLVVPTKIKLVREGQELELTGKVTVFKPSESLPDGTFDKP